MDILRGRNLLTTLDTPPVMPNRDTGRKSRFFFILGVPVGILPIKRFGTEKLELWSTRWRKKFDNMFTRHECDRRTDSARQQRRAWLGYSCCAATFAHNVMCSIEGLLSVIQGHRRGLFVSDCMQR